MPENEDASIAIDASLFCDESNVNFNLLSQNMKLRIAVQSKGRLNEDTMAILAEAGIKVSSSKRTLLVAARKFPMEVLYLRDDDIPETVTDGVADIGVVGLNEYMERQGDADIVKKLGFGGCRLSIAIPKEHEYTGPQWLQGRRIATSYPIILRRWLEEQGVQAHIHVITGSVFLCQPILIFGIRLVSIFSTNSSIKPTHSSK